MSEKKTVLMGDLTVAQIFGGEDRLTKAERNGEVSTLSPTHTWVDRLRIIVNERLAFADIGFLSGTAHQLQQQTLDTLLKIKEGKNWMHCRWVFPELAETVREETYGMPPINTKLPILDLLDTLKHLAMYGQKTAPDSLRELLAVADNQGTRPLDLIDETAATLLVTGLRTEKYQRFIPVFKDAVPVELAHLFLDAPVQVASAPEISPPVK